MTVIDSSRVADLRDRLRFMWQFLSWRQMADEFFPGVKFGTLQRIAGGDYLPKDRKILRALGLIDRRKMTEMEKRIAGMAKETRKAVTWKKTQSPKNG